MKWLTAALHVIIIFVVLWNREMIMEWMEVRDSANLLVVFLLVVVLAAVPGIPFGIVAGIIGAKYGLMWGSLLNVAASTAAAGVAYLTVRYLFQTWGSAVLARSMGLKRWNQAWVEHTFLFILLARMLPIVPAFLINIYAGVMSLSFKPFLLATVLGKIPVMVVFAYIGNHIQNGVGKWMIAVAVYAIFLILVYSFYKPLMKRRKRTIDNQNTI
ncbi:TVP38/TMEM64 family protein [Paenibacillus mendelii]|uniref:TVP38/TMEM64 family membrane protein n=1 Tax=Paenibacillus mendelii TaxID=206163 RepID=A0ABV6JFV1_9BACL|nr:VTT domain-containing protein [Paenibacillus mendelii]MCQ6557625.1 VTT domain-containing protein [Paenibacillus mendelii]